MLFLGHGVTRSAPEFNLGVGEFIRNRLGTDQSTGGSLRIGQVLSIGTLSFNRQFATLENLNHSSL